MVAPMWCLVTIGGSTSLGFIRHSASRWSGCTSGACVYHIVAHGTQHGTPQCARVHRESVMNCTRQCTENQGSTKHRVAPLRITIGESRHSACDTSTRCRVEMHQTRNAPSRVVLAVDHFIVEIMYYCTAMLRAIREMEMCRGSHRNGLLSDSPMSHQWASALFHIRF